MNQPLLPRPSRAHPWQRPYTFPVLDDTLKLILALPNRSPDPGLPARLDDLFRALADAPDAAEASKLEEAIWGLWSANEDTDAEEMLDRAAQAIAAREFDDAEALLDALVAAKPDYAEAWNKRATLYFLQKRDGESIADIERALALEPRHFGAICGFGQICLRRGERDAALFAFAAALRVNPHLGSVQQAVNELATEQTGPLH